MSHQQQEDVFDDPVSFANRYSAKLRFNFLQGLIECSMRIARTFAGNDLKFSVENGSILTQELLEFSLLEWFF